jgi:dTDP-4-dehydrorhamnose 3,5-epimerase
MEPLIEGVMWTPLRIVSDERGSVRKAIKASEPAFEGFGEAYFSSVEYGVVKGWKLHYRMHSNLIVVSGKIRFVLIDRRQQSPTFNLLNSFIISLENYSRLTIPPGILLGFQGLSATHNLLLNLSSIEHDPHESEVLALDSVENHSIDWSLSESP